MLTNLTNVDALPGMAGRPQAFKEILIASADRCVKDFLQRDIERHTYTEFYSGAGQTELILNQYPVISIENIWVDPNRTFGAGTLLNATDYELVLDGTAKGLMLQSNSPQVSNRGLVRRLGGGPLYGFFPGTPLYSGKLAATRLPTWSRSGGVQDIKVEYVAGYLEPNFPASLIYATTMLVAWMVRNMPSGAPLQSESLGAYSYSTMQVALNSSPELGTVARSLVPYRRQVL